MRITSKGQVTIPVDIREKLGLMPETEVDFILEEDGVRLVPRRDGSARRGSRIVDRLRGTGKGKMSTDEIMALTRGR